ncbi:MAG: hypothetical protein EON58_01945 [Alphaproteobacteria bacterium]|nr:MAG: hypothetical protein EON58_01945 [Alphaproteobacteria bacterium]
MPRKKQDDKNKVHGFSLPPDVFDTATESSSKWGLSKSAFVARAIVWYAQEVEKDPSKLQSPAKTQSNS